MSKPSKHERIIREELDVARNALAAAREVARDKYTTVGVFEDRVQTLERILDQSDAQKAGGGLSVEEASSSLTRLTHATPVKGRHQ